MMTMSNLSLSQKIGTRFPYDWSNPSGITEDVFIRLVMSRGLFNDMLTTICYMGFERVQPIFDEMEPLLPAMTKQVYANITIGYQNAQSRVAARKYEKPV